MNFDRRRVSVEHQAAQPQQLGMQHTRPSPRPTWSLPNIGMQRRQKLRRVDDLAALAKLKRCRRQIVCGQQHCEVGRAADVSRPIDGFGVFESNSDYWRRR